MIFKSKSRSKFPTICCWAASHLRCPMSRQRGASEDPVKKTGGLGENLSSRYRSFFSYVCSINSEFLHSKYIENKILNWNLAGSLQICNIAYDLPVARSSRINPFVFGRHFSRIDLVSEESCRWRGASWGWGLGGFIHCHPCHCLIRQILGTCRFSQKLVVETAISVPISSSKF